MSNHQIDKEEFDDIDDYIEDLEESPENYINNDDIDELDQIEEINPTDSPCSSQNESGLSEKLDQNVASTEIVPTFEDFDEVESVWEYRQGGALNENPYEYNLFTTYLNLGGGRSKQYISTLFKITKLKVDEVYRRNNWKYRSSMYDAKCLALANEDIDKQAIVDHQQKLEQYRTQQEIIAKQASLTASKILSINLRKINEILENNETPTIQEVTFLGSLANKLAILGKDLGAQALGVDALLEAIDEVEE